MIRTIITCDRCGREGEAIDGRRFLFNIVLTASAYDAHDTAWRAQWCHACAVETGVLPQAVAVVGRGFDDAVRECVRTMERKIGGEA